MSKCQTCLTLSPFIGAVSFKILFAFFFFTKNTLVNLFSPFYKEKIKLPNFLLCFKIMFYPKSKTNVEKCLAIYNSYFLTGSTIEVLLSALHCNHSSLIFCYKKKCLSVNPSLEFYQHYILIKLYMDCMQPFELLSS